MPPLPLVIQVPDEVASQSPDARAILDLYVSLHPSVHESWQFVARRYDERLVPGVDVVSLSGNWAAGHRSLPNVRTCWVPWRDRNRQASAIGWPGTG